MNQIKSLLLERGYLVQQGRAKLAVRLGEMLNGDEPVLGFAFIGGLPICGHAGKRSTSVWQISMQSSRRQPA
jgi:hypothetical protein